MVTIQMLTVVLVNTWYSRMASTQSETVSMGRVPRVSSAEKEGLWVEHLKTLASMPH